MPAARFTTPQDGLTITGVDVPEPRPGEAIIDVKAAGLCHSDLHILHGHVPVMGPITLGHEIAGVVAALGADVTEPAVGTRVVVYGVNPCGDCAWCRRGQENLCLTSPGQVGLSTDGGFAAKCRVRARNLIPIPESVSFAAAAVASDAILTPFHAIATVGNVRPGETAGIIGLGGLGLNAVAIANLLGATVIGVDTNPAKAGLARAAGAADVCADPNELMARQPDVIVDCVGSAATLNAAALAVRAGGRVVAVGLADTTAELFMLRVTAQEVAILGSFWGTSRELREILGLVAAGRLQPEVEEIGFDDVVDGYARLDKGETSGRLCITNP